MTAFAKNNPLRKPYTFKTNHMTVNQRMYGWADNLFFDELISAPILHTLKAIIATRHMKQPTIQQINDARTRSASTKFAQSDSVTNRTIMRHIEKLEKLKYIKVTREKIWLKTRNAYTICVPCQVLVKARSDIMSPSLSSSSPRRGGGANNYKKQTKKSIQHTASAASPGPNGPAAAAKSWQDELREQYEQKAIEASTPEEIKIQAKKQFKLLKQMLGG